jgi:hypothetical protein
MLVEKHIKNKQIKKLFLATLIALIVLILVKNISTDANVIMILKNRLGWNIPTWIAQSLAAVSFVGKINSACAILLGVTVAPAIAGAIAAAGTAAA